MTEQDEAAIERLGKAAFAAQGQGSLGVVVSLDDLRRILAFAKLGEDHG